jgi:hypothetical protein
MTLPPEDVRCGAGVDALGAGGGLASLGALGAGELGATLAGGPAEGAEKFANLGMSSLFGTKTNTGFGKD